MCRLSLQYKINEISTYVLTISNRSLSSAGGICTLTSNKLFSSADGKIHLTFHQVKSLGIITWAQLLKCDWRVESKYFKTKKRYFWQQFGENVFCITYEELAIISAATDVNKSTPLSLSQCGHVSLYGK